MKFRLKNLKKQEKKDPLSFIFLNVIGQPKAASKTGKQAEFVLLEYAQV